MTSDGGRPGEGNAEATDNNDFNSNDNDNDTAVRLDDAFIGAHIADHYLEDFTFVVGLGWLKFDGRRWVSVSTEIVGEAIRLAVIDFHHTEAKAGQDHRRLQRIDTLLSAGKLKALQGIARNRLCRVASEFDAHPDLLNVGNGVVDLRDGTRNPHDRGLLLTKMTRVDYVPGATHLDWDQALDALPSTEIADWLQERFGQGLTGYATPDDRLVTLEGSGSNGKTSIVDSIREAAGEYAVSMPERVLLARQGDHPTELMVLRGARLAFMEEFPELGHLNVKRLKDLHGTNRMSARYCGKDTVEWTSSHTAFVTTNYMPRVDESDDGTWRRLVLVEFPYRYRSSDEEICTRFDRRGDLTLRERMRLGRDGQHEAVLAWVVDGAVRWYQRGQVMPSDPAGIRESTARWRRSADLLLNYIDERLVLDPESYVMSVELFENFKSWLRDSGHTPWSDQTFTKRFADHHQIKGHGVAKKIVRSTRYGLSRPPGRLVQDATGRLVPNQFTGWVGIRFRNEDDFEVGDEQA